MNSTKASVNAKRPDLKAAWERLRTEQGINSQRDGAAMLGVPEVVLQDASSGPSVIRLKPKFAELIQSARNFGRVLTLVRNDSFIAMPVGEFEEVSIKDSRGRAHGGPVDVSFDLTRWGTAYGLIDESKGAVRRSLYFFDDCGEAAMKVLVWSKDGEPAFNEVIERFRDDDPGDVVIRPRNDADWRSAEDFAGGRSTKSGAPKRALDLLQTVVDREINVDLRIPTRAAEERYVGPIRSLRARETEGWYDVTYPHFNTHLGTLDIARCALKSDGTSGTPLVGFIDARDRVICRLTVAPDANAQAKAAWAKAVEQAFAD